MSSNNFLLLLNASVLHLKSVSPSLSLTHSLPPFPSLFLTLIAVSRATYKMIVTYVKAQ